MAAPSESTPKSGRGHYGLDSPGIVAGLLIAALIAWGVAGLYPHVLGRMHFLLWLAGGYLGVGGLGMIYYSKAGKLRLREELLDSVSWRGDEQVLDIGCGRGLLTIGAAHRVAKGRVMGVDIWVKHALTGNGAQGVLDNALCEGVRDRVAAQEGSALALPFADGTFDVVVSNYVLHELKASTDRATMLAEIVRVLKPGGRMAVVDFIFTGEAVQILREIGSTDAARFRIGSWLGWYLTVLLNFGFVQNHRITATKPA